MISKVYQLSDEDFIKLVKESYSYCDVVNSIGLSTNGKNGNYQVKKRMSELNLTENDFLTKNKKTTSNVHYYELDEILVENSTYTNRTRMKERILKADLLEYRCAQCGNIGEWGGKPLSLQIDHINGINNDNRIENLRFLCPNCHSQTGTFSGRNKS